MAKITFAGQMLALQVVVVLSVVAIATVTYGAQASAANRVDAQQSALTIARTVAQVPELRDDVERVDASGSRDASVLAAGPIERLALAIGERTGALFVVVTDSRGIRLAHPDRAMLGKMVSTDPSAALAGRESTGWETGTLGESARAKVPVFAADGTTVVGEVSVGFGAGSVLRNIRADLLGVGLVAALALAVGIAASAILARRLRRLTLGLQPAELAELVHDQAAVLGGIGEGVLGIAPDGRVGVCNGRAAELLQLEEPVGRNVDTLALPPGLLAALGAADAVPALRRVVFRGRLLYLDVSRVRRAGTDLGSVVVVRDETDMESMSRRLTAVTAMSTALRVQRHEFANRLHLVSGLLATGAVDDARHYLGGLINDGPVDYPLDSAGDGQPAGYGALREPSLRAFLGAKALQAHERGVALRIGEGTFVRGALVRPEEATTVLGNLIDNAVTAAVLGERRQRWVEVELLDDGVDLHVTVADSGDGIPVAMAVEPGTDEGGAPPGGPLTGSGSTPSHGDAGMWRVGATSAVAPAGDAASRDEDRDAGEHGTDDGTGVHGLGFGLPLSRDLARRRGGDVWVAEFGGGGSGAVFCARLAAVMEPPARGDSAADAPATAERG